MDRKQILASLASKAITLEEAETLLGAADKANGVALRCKVSDKGAVSIYGLQRMPVTLYVEQWERLLAFAEDLKAFLEAHRGELHRKEKAAK